MYIYFDYSGNLKEIVSYPVRQGDDNSKTIYVYVESSANPQMSDDMYKLPANITAASIAFKLVDTDENLGNLNAMTKVSTGLEIPYDKSRDLKYFKYWKKYQFWKYTLQSAQTVANGVVAATVTLSDTVESREYVLDTFAFNVQASVGIIPDSSLNYSQYQYLFSKITALENAENVFVPYTGADDNVNLGNHSLAANSIGVYNTFQGNTVWCGGFGSSNNGNLYIESEHAIILEASNYYIDSVSDNNKIAKVGDLSYYLPLTGGTLAGNLEIKKAGTSDNYIRVWNKDDAHSGYLGADTTGLLTMYESSQWRKIATRNYVDNATKLYRHIVQVANYGHIDYVTLVIISKSGNGVQSLDELDSVIQGYVSGFYEDEHSLFFSLLKCSVNLTAFDFTFIDENHDFFDATWSNALVSNDTVEEI